MLGLGDDAARLAPAVEGAPEEVGKRRAGPPFVKLSSSAAARSSAMAATRRWLRASPKT
jgi:hypothetical protein